MSTYERGERAVPLNPNRSDAPDPSAQDGAALATELALLPLAFALNAASVFVELWFRGRAGSGRSPAGSRFANALIVAAIAQPAPRDGAKFKVGDLVEKASGYRYPGIVRSVYPKGDGELRYDVEADHPDFAGMLHIFSEAQLVPRRKAAAQARKGN